MKLLRDQDSYRQEWQKIHEIARGYFAIPGVVKQSVHLLREGNKRKEYIDFDMAIFDPARCENIAILFANQINEICDSKNIDFLVFIDKGGEGTVGAIALVGALEMSISLPIVYVRPWKDIREERIKSRCMGNPHFSLDDGVGILVTDHCTTGREALHCIDLLRKKHARIEDVVAYSYRVQDFDSESFAKNNIDFYSMYNDPKDILKAGVKLQIGKSE